MPPKTTLQQSEPAIMPKTASPTILAAEGMMRAKQKEAGQAMMRARAIKSKAFRARIQGL